MRQNDRICRRSRVYLLMRVVNALLFEILKKEAQSMTQNAPSPEENMAQIRELALRLLAPPFDPEARQPQLLVGSLPASLPFDLPLPDGCQIVGSFVRNPETIQIVFDTDQSPAEVIAFYTE